MVLPLEEQEGAGKCDTAECELYAGDCLRQIATGYLTYGNEVQPKKELGMLYPLTTYTFVSKDDAIRVMDGDLSISDALEMGLCTAETRPYTVAELRAQIATSYTSKKN